MNQIKFIQVTTNYWILKPLEDLIKIYYIRCETRTTENKKLKNFYWIIGRVNKSGLIDNYEHMKIYDEELEQLEKEFQETMNNHLTKN